MQNEAQDSYILELKVFYLYFAHVSTHIDLFDSIAKCFLVTKFKKKAPHGSIKVVLVTCTMERN